MTHEFYILRNREIVPATMEEWAAWFQANAPSRVCETTYDNVWISTVFLGLNHRMGEGPPMIFETMIFGGPYDQHQVRSSTWEEAWCEHRAACELVERARSA